MTEVSHSAKKKKGRKEKRKKGKKEATKEGYQS